MCLTHTYTHTVQNSVIILNICAQVQSVHKSVSKSPGSSQETSPEKSVCVVQSRNQTVFVVKCGSSTVFEWTTDKTTTNVNQKHIHSVGGQRSKLDFQCC